MDFQEPNSSKFRFEFDPDSIDTNNASRDVELRAPNCLNAAQFKTIVFESTSVKSEDESASIGRTKRTFQVTGNLAMRGVTRQITIPIELLAMGNGPNGNMRCGFMSRFVVNRSDFGIDKQKDTVGESIAVTFCFQAIHQQPKADEKKGVNPFELKSSQPRNPDSNDRKDSEQERLKELFRSDVIDSEDRSTEAFDEEESNDPGQLLEVD